MKTIYKYPIEVQDHFQIELPKNAQILTIQMQHEQPCLWVLVDTQEKLETRSFRLAGTGHPINEEDATYINTFQSNGGHLIFHLFEIK